MDFSISVAVPPAGPVPVRVAVHAQVCRPGLKNCQGAFGRPALAESCMEWMHLIVGRVTPLIVDYAPVDTGPVPPQELDRLDVG